MNSTFGLCILIGHLTDRLLRCVRSVKDLAALMVLIEHLGAPELAKSIEVDFFDNWSARRKRPWDPYHLRKKRLSKISRLVWPKNSTNYANVVSRSR
jgi:hypothetical protein